MNANSKMPRLLFYCILPFCLLFGLSCAVTKVSRSEAIQIADKAFAQFSGLSYVDTVRDVSWSRGDWIITYDRKPSGDDELTLGDHWGVLVNDKSGETRII